MEEQQLPDGLPVPRRRLGRGLNSLIGMPAADESAAPPNAPGEFMQIAVDTIERNPYQPRKEFEPEALNELVESIGQHGVLQPLLVRLVDSGFQLIAGERRLMAARRAGLQTVPCRVIELEERAVSEVAIVENLQRADLNDLEKAQAFHDYIERYGSSIEDLARKLGKDRSTVSNTLRLLELPEFVKVALHASRISASHARALLPLEEEADQIAMCQKIQSESLNVRQTEEEVRLKLQPQVTVPFQRPDEKQVAQPATVSNHVLSLQQQLRDLVGAKVEIRMKGKDAGKMIIHFSSNDEFERIVQHLKKAS